VWLQLPNKQVVSFRGQGKVPKVANTESGMPNVSKFMNKVFRGSSYSIQTAIADIVDNSLEAQADTISIQMDVTANRISICDNGFGMDDVTHRESMKIAAETREYSDEDLGKFGTGMKSASLSHARRLVVATRAKGSGSITVRALDLDHVEEVNDWNHITLILSEADLPEFALKHLKRTHGTVIIWEKLDRVFSDIELSLQDKREEMLHKIDQTSQHLGMVFHRFLSGEAFEAQKLTLTLNNRGIQAWDPFCRTERTLEVCNHTLSFGGHEVKVHGYVLPSEKEFSTRAAFQDAAGVKKWNDSQGFYVYRSNRLIRWGGWLKMKAAEPHSSLARISIDLPGGLDEILQLDVQKSKIELPLALKRLLDPVATDVRSKANKRYRSKLSPNDLSQLPGRGGASVSVTRRKLTALALVSVLEKVATENNQQKFLSDLKQSVRLSNPEIAEEIGW
jgi:hypothetical protein